MCGCIWIHQRCIQSWNFSLISGNRCVFHWLTLNQFPCSPLCSWPTTTMSHSSGFKSDQSVMVITFSCLSTRFLNGSLNDRKNIIPLQEQLWTDINNTSACYSRHDSTTSIFQWTRSSFQRFIERKRDTENIWMCLCEGTWISQAYWAL